MDTIYYVYDTAPHDDQIEGLVTADHTHWRAIDTTLTEAIIYLSRGRGWKINNNTRKPGELLYTSETHPELFI